MPVYWRLPRRPAPREGVNAKGETNVCNDCKVIYGDVNIRNMGFDTEQDAYKVVLLFLPAVRARGIRQAWDVAWNRFRCTNQTCQIKQPCENHPIWMEIGSRPARDAQGRVVWAVYVRMARRIKCVAGDVQEADAEPAVQPDVPDEQGFFPREEQFGGDGESTPPTPNGPGGSGGDGGGGQMSLDEPLDRTVQWLSGESVRYLKGLDC